MPCYLEESREHYLSGSSDTKIICAFDCAQEVTRTKLIHYINGFWRKGWDSNPRYPCRHAGFQDRCLKPLGHPSVAAVSSTWGGRDQERSVNKCVGVNPWGKFWGFA